MDEVVGHNVAYGVEDLVHFLVLWGGSETCKTFVFVLVEVSVVALLMLVAKVVAEVHV